MDKIKVILFIVPLTFEIFHDEFGIRGHPAGLDRAYVISNDVSTRKFTIILLSIARKNGPRTTDLHTQQCLKPIFLFRFLDQGYFPVIQL